MNEDQWVETYISPRCQRPGDHWLGPGDDAAIAPWSHPKRPVLTVDAMLEGQHFLDHWLDDASIARRLLRSTISDLHAMGAVAVGILISIETPQLPGRVGEQFWKSIDEECQHHQMHLLGGNVARSDGPLSLHCTALGRLVVESPWLRSGARPGDLLAVTGDPGSAACARHRIETGEETADDDHWRWPRCRRSLVEAIASEERQICIGAAIDISDGLLLDLSRLCRSSGLAARLQHDSMRMLEAGPGLQQLLHGGEDYELILTVPPASRSTLERVAASTATPLHWIGTVEKGPAGHIESTGSGSLETMETIEGWDPFAEPQQ